MANGPVEKSFQPLSEHPCWGLHYDRQLNLSINFGQPALSIREPYNTGSRSEVVRRLASKRLVTVCGEWWLWLYCCHWQLTDTGQKTTTGSSSIRQIQQSLARLEGQKLRAAEVDPKTGATSFFFDLGSTLSCRRFDRHSDSELWLLYKPRGYVLSVTGNGMFAHQLASAAKQQPRPIKRSGRRSAKRT